MFFGKRCKQGVRHEIKRLNYLIWLYKTVALFELIVITRQFAPLHPAKSAARGVCKQSVFAAGMMLLFAIYHA